MDAKQTELEEELAGILKKAADVACQIQAVEQGPGTPHYDQIEIPAHEVGQRLSRMVQASRTGEVAAQQRSECNCPDCGRSCCVEVNKRADPRLHPCGQLSLQRIDLVPRKERTILADVLCLDASRLARRRRDGHR